MARNEHSSGDGEVGEVKDMVLRALVKDFAQERGVSGSKARQFVAFVSHALLNHRHGVDVQNAVELLITDGPGDGGLDAICILADGEPVFTHQEAEELVRNKPERDKPPVEFVFVQAKTSSRFEASEIGTFGFGIRRFLSAALADDPSADVAQLNEAVKRYIAVARVFLRGKNVFEVLRSYSFYFVTTGTWTGTPDLADRLEDEQRLIKDKVSGEDHVDGLPVGAALLKQIAREARGAVRRVIDIEGLVKVPTPPDKVDNAYVGLIRGTEFIKLVSTADGGMLNRDLFYDNVRDYLGDNPVNHEIAQTLTEEQSRHHFPLLNNGVTIVAQRMKDGTGRAYEIENFQVVNGCQSTHVLFRNKDDVDDNTFIPVKIIVTKDTDTIIKVVKATNRQTTIELERLVVLRPFHKELESLYEAYEKAHSAKDRLYYERRTHQYAGEGKDKEQIVTFPEQTVSFAGMFLNVPHECTSGGHRRVTPLTAYKAIHQKHEKRLFGDDDKPHPYYASIVCEKAYERWVKRKDESEGRELKEWKYHVLMLLRVALAGHRVPAFNSNAIIKYSEKLIIASRDEGRWNDACEGAVKKLREARTTALPGGFRSIMSERPGGGPDVQVLPSNSDFTRHLIQSDRVRGEATSQESSESRRAKADDRRPAGDDRRRGTRGTVTSFDQVRFSGLIEMENGEVVTVYGVDHKAFPLEQWKPGTRVWVKVGEDNRPERTGGRKKATEVELDE